MKAIRFVLALAFITATSHAQEPAAPTRLPTPIMVRPPDFSKWTITYESLDPKKPGVTTGNAAPATLVTKITVVTKTGDIRHEHTTDATGQQADMWWKGTLQLLQSAHAGPPIISMGGNKDDLTYVDYSKSDFANLDWIAQENFTGVKTVLGKSCWSFHKIQGFLTNSEPGPSHSPQFEYTAYIDKATQLPVQLKVGVDTVRYTFEKPPAETQVLPRDLQAAVSALAKRERALSAPLPRPF